MNKRLSRDEGGDGGMRRGRMKGGGSAILLEASGKKRYDVLLNTNEQSGRVQKAPLLGVEKKKTFLRREGGKRSRPGGCETARLSRVYF